MFFFFLAIFAIILSTGKRVMGTPGDKPEFSNFSWFSMRFGAGLGVVATILGVSVTIGYGISQFIDGVYVITGMQWVMDLGGEVPTPSKVGLIAGLLVIMSLSVISAVSGVGRGVKSLSNPNLVLSIILLGTFVVFGSFVFAMTTYGTAMVDYILHFL